MSRQLMAAHRLWRRARRYNNIQKPIKTSIRVEIMVCLEQAQREWETLVHL